MQGRATGWISRHRRVLKALAWAASAFYLVGLLSPFIAAVPAVPVWLSRHLGERVANLAMAWSLALAVNFITPVVLLLVVFFIYLRVSEPDRELRAFFGIGEQGRVKIYLGMFNLDDKVMAAGVICDTNRIPRTEPTFAVPSEELRILPDLYDMLARVSYVSPPAQAIGISQAYHASAVPEVVFQASPHAYDEPAYVEDCKEFDTIICLGGPRYNRVSKYLLGPSGIRNHSFPTPAAVYQESDYYQQCYAGTQCQRFKDAPNARYGLITRTHPQNNLDHTDFILGGLKTAGTVAAAIYLTRHWSDLYSKWQNGGRVGEFAEVVCVTDHCGSDIDVDGIRRCDPHILTEHELAALGDVTKQAKP